MVQILPYGILMDEELCQNSEHQGENPPILTQVEEDTGWVFKEPEYEEWCPRCYRDICDLAYKGLTQLPIFHNKNASAEEIKDINMIFKFNKIFGVSPVTKIILYLFKLQDKSFILKDLAKAAMVDAYPAKEVLWNFVDLGLLTKSEKIGRVYYYKINLENSSIKSIFNLLYTMREEK